MNCKYKDALGVPGKGSHSFRFMGFSVSDTVMTFIGAWILAKAIGLRYLPTLLGLLILGEIMHWYFCVDTAFIKLIKKYQSGKSTPDLFLT